MDVLSGGAPGARSGEENRLAAAPALTIIGDGTDTSAEWLFPSAGLPAVPACESSRFPYDGRVGTEASLMTCARLLNRNASYAILLVACAALLPSAVSPASAQGTVAQREACEGDAFKFCSEFIPFVHAIENCLARNIRKLTPACQIQMRGGTPAPRKRR
jgi:hypothetical protein